MGQLRFLLPRREQAGPEALSRVYLAGLDDLPWRARFQATEQGFVAERSDSESCYCYIPWQTTGFGALTLATATLREREEPYHLPVELARGTIIRVRNQLAQWESVGLVASPAVVRNLSTATRELARAALAAKSDPSAAADLAQVAIDAGLAANTTLVDDFIEQSISARRRMHPKLPTLLGACVGTGPLEGVEGTLLQKIGNTACVPISWRAVEAHQGQYNWAEVDRQFEACHALGLRICAGPLLQLADHAVPDWLSLWEGDFEHLVSFVTNFVGAAVARYRGKVGLWHAAASINLSDALPLGEDQQLQLTAQILETMRQSEPQAPVIVSVSQPWAEYMGRQDFDLSPLHFADTIARADLNLAGIGLELEFGFGLHQTQPRDWLEISRQIDRWTALGLPLVILPGTPIGPFASPAAQLDWTDRFMSLLLGKPAVQGIFWTQWRDQENGTQGLLDANGQPKPAYQAIHAIKQRWLT